MNTSEELEQEIARVWKTLNDDFVYQLHWEDFREAAIHFVNWQRERMNPIWHKSNEKPRKNGDRIVWIDKRYKMMHTGWYNKDAFGHDDLRDPITKYNFDEITKWAYCKDLINIKAED